KLVEDLQIINKELAEYNNSPSWDRPTFFNDNEDRFVQYKEYLENPSNEIAASNSNQEKEKPPQDSDIRQFVREECGINICEKQKKNVEDTMLELVEVYRQKGFYCMHDNVDDLLKVLLILNFFRLIWNLNNFRVIHKSSTFFNNTSQISPVHAIALILPTKEPEYSLSMGLMERLFTIDLCPRPMENSNTIVETLPTSTILVEDSDSQREEIDIFTGTDDLLPPDIESDNYDSEGDINVLEELLVDDSIPKNDSFYFDDQDDPHFPVLLRNHQMFSLIWSPILEKKFQQ
nr:hypothetical protein [Tanacetum cinerariifolium]